MDRCRCPAAVGSSNAAIRRARCSPWSDRNADHSASYSHRGAPPGGASRLKTSAGEKAMGSKLVAILATALLSLGASPLHAKNGTHVFGPRAPGTDAMRATVGMARPAVKSRHGGTG